MFQRIKAFCRKCKSEGIDWPTSGYGGERSADQNGISRGSAKSREYTLTETGYSLKPILDAMQTWGEQYKIKNS